MKGAAIVTDNLADHMPLSKLLGVQVTQASPDCVEGTLEVTAELCTLAPILHGGSIMAFADTLGGIAAYLSLPEGAEGTTTVESKTNFLRAAPVGTTVTGRTEPVNIGRRLSVWTTTITGEDGKTVAVVTQTQMVL